MSVPELGNRRLCSCCNKVVSRSTAQRHQRDQEIQFSLPVQPESPSPSKRRRTTHFQAGQESLVIPPDKQKQSRTDNISSTSRSRADASDHPQLHAPSVDEFNPSLPLPGPPPAQNLVQPPGDALTEASIPFIDDVLLNFHSRTHRTTDQSDDDDSEGAPEEDAVEAADCVDHETDDFWNGEDLAVEGDVDPRAGIVSDWDLLTEEFIVEAEELGEFRHSLLHIS
jgi:hypothetical protein